MSRHLLEIKRALLGLAEYYDKALTETQLAMYADDLSDMPPILLQNAVKAYRRDSKHTRFPLPAALRACVLPDESSRDIANDLARRIIQAIERRGYVWETGFLVGGKRLFDGGGKPWPTFEQAVTAELGSLAWEVVRRRGFKTMHEDYYDVDHGTFFAQLRDHVEAVMNKSKSGRLNNNPELPDVALVKLPAPEVSGSTG